MAFAAPQPAGVESAGGQVIQLRPPVDEAAYRNAMAKLASGVAVVACWHNAEPRGLLVSSLTGLSSDPPRILFCVRKASAAHDALLAADACSISILGEEDAVEAGRFSRADLAPQRFGRDWRLERKAPPRLRQALASLWGPVRCRIDAGSHTIFILDIGHAEARDGEPLVYFERDFHGIGPA